MTKGSYQLLLHLPNERKIAIGRLGAFAFPAGYYIYTGSAMGGLEARIARHFRKNKRLHWHIDYLLEECTIIRYAIKESASRRECDVNAATLALQDARVIVKGFGSSDCGCVAHLVWLRNMPGRLPIEY